MTSDVKEVTNFVRFERADRPIVDVRPMHQHIYTRLSSAPSIVLTWASQTCQYYLIMQERNI